MKLIKLCTLLALNLIIILNQLVKCEEEPWPIVLPFTRFYSDLKFRDNYYFEKPYYVGVPIKKKWIVTNVVEQCYACFLRYLYSRRHDVST